MTSRELIEQIGHAANRLELAVEQTVLPTTIKHADATNFIVTADMLALLNEILEHHRNALNELSKVQDAQRESAGQ